MRSLFRFVLLCCALQVQMNWRGSAQASEHVRNIEVPEFDDNLYAQLLMRTVTGSVYPVGTFSDVYRGADFPKQVSDSVHA